MSTENTETKTDAVDDNAARSAARSAALSALRKAHIAEYNDLLTQEMQARGVDWKPRPTPQEKAQAKIRRLAAENGLNLEDVLSTD